MTWHGTAGGYRHHACRCADCRSAHSEAVLVASIKRRTRMLGGTATAQAGARSQPRAHGILSTYDNWRCRCVACCAAKADSNKEYRDRQRQSTN